MGSKKIDDFTIEVTKETVHTDVKKYDYNFLLSQKKAIEADKEKYNKLRDAELEEINTLIAECDKIGIKPKEEKEDK